ncbi:MAG: DUF6142 family protein [Lachnospiraceae bacterium]|nr:DUF6142 family protein [Lachnospiraceae bacterium]
MGLLGHYKFTNKKHPLTGIMSTILGSIAVITLGLAVYLGFLARGEVAPQYALAVFLGLIMAVVGLVLGIYSRLKRDLYYFFPNLGILLNGGTIFTVWVMFTESFIAG